jgi:hypothetical protein
MVKLIDCEIEYVNFKKEFARQNFSQKYISGGGLPTTFCHTAGASISSPPPGINHIF